MFHQEMSSPVLNTVSLETEGKTSGRWTGSYGSKRRLGYRHGSEGKAAWQTQSKMPAFLSLLFAPRG